MTSVSIELADYVDTLRGVMPAALRRARRGRVACARLLQGITHLALWRGAEVAEIRLRAPPATRQLWRSGTATLCRPQELLPA